MFEKLKQLQQLKSLQDQLAKEVVTVEKNGVKLVMNGKMEIEQLSINPDLDKENQEKAIKECFTEALKKVQMAAAQKMFSM